MKKEFLVIVLFFGLLLTGGCTDETNGVKTSPEASRPIVPVNDNEVQIGNQIWMAKNINVSRYRNGDIIPQVQDASQWTSINYGAWCYYENNSANGRTYGKLYNLAAVMDPRGLAPEGWHVATDDDWINLFINIGGFFSGGKLKATNFWESPNTAATNISGFTALPGGIREGDAGTFLRIGQQGNWWTSSYVFGNSGDARYYRLFSDSGDIGGGSSYTQFGMSVRCVKDPL